MDPMTISRLSRRTHALDRRARRMAHWALLVFVAVACGRRPAPPNAIMLIDGFETKMLEGSPPGSSGQAAADGVEVRRSGAANRSAIRPAPREPRSRTLRRHARLRSGTGCLRPRHPRRPPGSDERPAICRSCASSAPRASTIRTRCTRSRSGCASPRARTCSSSPVRPRPSISNSELAQVARMPWTITTPVIAGDTDPDLHHHSPGADLRLAHPSHPDPAHRRGRGRLRDRVGPPGHPARAPGREPLPA